MQLKLSPKLLKLYSTLYQICFAFNSVQNSVLSTNCEIWQLRVSSLLCWTRTIASKINITPIVVYFPILKLHTILVVITCP